MVSLELKKGTKVKFRFVKYGPVYSGCIHGRMKEDDGWLCRREEDGRLYRVTDKDGMVRPVGGEEEIPMTKMPRQAELPLIPQEEPQAPAEPATFDQGKELASEIKRHLGGDAQ